MKRIRFPYFALLSCFLAMPLTSLGYQTPPDARTGSVAIAVATNFVQPMQKIIAAFKQEHDGELKLITGSSGKLYAQILNGAPYDLFYSADSDKPAHLEAAGLTRLNQRYTYAMGSLVFWSADKGKTLAPSILENMQFDRLAIANPKLAPYGAAARQTLLKMGLWSKLQDKLVYGENIAQTYQFVATANAQYGLLALSQIVQQPDQMRGSYWPIPENYYAPIHQQAVMLSRAGDNPMAHKFYRFMQSDKVRQIIQQYGYSIERKEK